MPRSEREDVVADDALQPFDPVLARNPDLAPMREVHDAGTISDSVMLGNGVAIVIRDIPSGPFDNGCAKLEMSLVKFGTLHFLPRTSWTNASVLEENSFRETILATPICWARFQLSTSS